jgi:hypothetical protein
MKISLIDLQETWRTQVKLCRPSLLHFDLVSFTEENFYLGALDRREEELSVVAVESRP